MTISKKINRIGPSKRQILGYIFSCAIFCIGFSSPAMAVTLKVATLATDGSVWMRTIREASKKIKKETENRVKMKFFAGGVMGNDQQVLRRISIGQLDGAAVVSGSIEGFYKNVQLYGLPFIFHDYAEVDYIRARMDKQIRMGIEDAGLVNFGFAEGGFAYAMTIKFITSVADARRQKVWVPSDDSGAIRAVQAYGITPIPLALSDVLLALQTGTINAVAGPGIAAVALQWHTHIRNVIELPLIYTYGLMVVAKKRFNKIQKPDQLIVRKHMEQAFAKLDAINRKDGQLSLQALRGQGIRFQIPNATETSEWQKLAKKSVQEIVADNIVDADIYQQMLEHLNTYRQSQN